MIPIEFLKTMEKIGKLIEAGQRDKAIQLLDAMHLNIAPLMNIMHDAQKMEVLGLIAHRYREAGATEKEIPVLEKLCEIALQHLDRLGILASSEEIYLTAMDLLLLGFAYLKTNRKTEAYNKLMQAKELFAEIDWEIDVDEMMEGKNKVYIGPKGGRDLVLKELKDLPAEYERPALVPYRKGGEWFYVYFP